jgi:hypothetical protein
MKTELVILRASDEDARRISANAIAIRFNDRVCSKISSLSNQTPAALRPPKTAPPFPQRWGLLRKGHAVFRREDRVGRSTVTQEFNRFTAEKKKSRGINFPVKVMALA